MTKPLNLDLITYDPGIPASSVVDFTTKIISTIEGAWATGADLVVLPEFVWLGLSPHLQQSSEPLRTLSERFWKELVSILQEHLRRPGKAVVLGTVPCSLPDGRILNRSLIFADGKILHQDKLHLTPWETDFSPGEQLFLWTFAGFRIAVVICLDIEIPELSARLRDSEVDLILCPSATETVLGMERVNRCASARAVELGCYVGVSHLTGRAACDLIDENVGLAAVYRPSQAAFMKAPRIEQTELHTSGSRTLRVALDRHPLDAMRRMKAETNPSHLGREMAGIARAIRVESIGQF